MPDTTLSSLERIRIKVRRLTRSPSASQITDATINDYVNNFLLYDFPAHIVLPSLKSTYLFMTQPYISEYFVTTATGIANVGDSNYNQRVSITGPAYVSGSKVEMSLDREEFYDSYPKQQITEVIATGDGVTADFTGTLSNIPVMQRNVLFSAVDTDNEPISLIDVPTDVNDGVLVSSVTGLGLGTINYITGAYVVNVVATKTGVPVEFHTVPYETGKPEAVLFEQNKFTLWPISDTPYRVEVGCQVRPAQLLTTASYPELARWWQYIAYGAAKKIFEDRMDMDSVAAIMPEFKEQEVLIQRVGLVSNANKRVKTIYSNGGIDYGV